MSSSTKSPNAANRKKLEDIIRPIETAAITLILCVSGITVSNFYFGANYTSRMVQLRARNESLSKSFEIFNDFCLIVGMVCIFRYLVWSNKEAKQLMFYNDNSYDVPTKEARGTSYLFRSASKNTSTKVASKHRIQDVIPPKPQSTTESFYNRFIRSTAAEAGSTNEEKIEDAGSTQEDQAMEAFPAPRHTRRIDSQLQVPTLGDNY
eukprot:snap_masked-scaffold_14-processed-gene-6.45-mRNA-1 protein AED:1.00 eAED:1.00 QI:0/0/0/0/1/1/2/0/206